MNMLRNLAIASAALCALGTSHLAVAAPVYQSVDQSFANSPVSFTIDGNNFTFSATGDGFNPAAIETSGGGEVSAFGGFLNIPITPSSYFTNRGDVVIGPGEFAAFDTPTTVPYSNGDNYFGLEIASGGNDYFGFAYTTDTTLNSYGFETLPGTAITATSAVPEPAIWTIMLAGIAMMGAVLRINRKRALTLAA